MSPRARDRLGRPLPAGVGEPEPDPPLLPEAETIELAQALLDDGRAFRAHEVFETRWKGTAGDDRQLWRGLAQLAVGITHAQRGNVDGAVALLERAADTLAPWEGQVVHAVDVAAVRAWALRAAETVRTAGAGPLAVPRLRRSGD